MDLDPRTMTMEKIEMVMRIGINTVHNNFVPTLHTRSTEF